MHAIFYDLETSDRNFVGQILNFSFVCVDERYNIIDQLSGNVRISPLQLPSPAAIRANRINVIEHQRTADFSEKEAMRQIAQFIEGRLAESENLGFIGYNSSRFDLPFLRTSLMRNGINPYFQRRLIYRDLLHLVRKLSCSNAGFPRRAGDENKLSLRLETLAHEFELLKGRQAHSAKEDVLLTIALAEVIKKKFGIDVINFDAYEAAAVHTSVRTGSVYNLWIPNYDLTLDRLREDVPHTLLDADHRYALWIDLNRYEQNAGEGMGRKAVSWFSRQTSSFFSDCVPVEDSAAKNLAQKALEELRSLNLKNFFTASSCDIEQDIYRLDFSMIEMLCFAMWHGKKDEVKEKLSKDAKVVLLRHELANFDFNGSAGEAALNKLREYALYRYGGRLRLSKFEDLGEDRQPLCHPTFNELMQEIEASTANLDQEDVQLMTALKEFYLTSPLYRACGGNFVSTDSGQN